MNLRSCSMPTADLNIFDFDMTLTRKHTFNNRALKPESNTKEGLKSLFDKATFNSIATFHDDPDYIISYIEKIMNVKFQKVGESDSLVHDKLTVYTSDELTNPIIISSVSNEFHDYEYNQRALSKTGKNTQIEHILQYLNENDYLNEGEYSVHFYDDTNDNIIKSDEIKDRTLPKGVVEFIAYQVSRAICDKLHITSTRTILTNSRDEEEKVNILSQACRNIPLPTINSQSGSENEQADTKGDDFYQQFYGYSYISGEDSLSDNNGDKNLPNYAECNYNRLHISQDNDTFAAHEQSLSGNGKRGRSIPDNFQQQLTSQSDDAVIVPAKKPKITHASLQSFSLFSNSASQSEPYMAIKELPMQSS